MRVRSRKCRKTRGFRSITASKHRVLRALRHVQPTVFLVKPIKNLEFLKGRVIFSRCDVWKQLFIIDFYDVYCVSALWSIVKHEGSKAYRLQTTVFYEASRMGFLRFFVENLCKTSSFWRCSLFSLDKCWFSSVFTMFVCVSSRHSL